MRARFALLLSLLLSLSAITPAAPLPDTNVIHLDHAAGGFQPLDRGQLAWLCDEQGAQTLDEVRAADIAGRFHALPGNFARGYTRHACWLRFHVRRDADDRGRWWLEVIPPFIDNLRMYVVAPDGSAAIQAGGDLVPHRNAPFDYRAPLFFLDPPAGDSTVFLRLQGNHSLMAVAAVWRTQALSEAAFWQYCFFGLEIGLFIAILILTAVNWILLRGELFALYFGYVAMLALYTVSATGLLSQFALPDSPEVAHLTVPVTLALATAFGIPLFVRLLQTDPHDRVLRLLLPFTTGVALVAGLASVTDWAIAIFPVLHVTLALAVTALLPTGWRRMRHGTPTERLSALALATYGLVIFGSVSILLGLHAPTRFAMLYVQAGTLLHLFLLHAATTTRLRADARERELLSQQAAAARIEAEQERRRSEEHDQLLSMITHEIRTPIAVIAAAAQTLPLLDGQPASERAVRYERIQRGIHRLGLLLELALNRVRPAMASGNAAPLCDLNDLSREVVSQFEPQQEQQVNLWMAESTARVSTRPDLLRFALLNLLDNACKYSPPRSVVNIEIVATARSDAAGFLWRICDQGSGISVEARERIFEKYYRENEQAGAAGLGLGLYIARHIVRQAGGELDCVEPPGSTGACFELWLPAARLEG